MLFSWRKKKKLEAEAKKQEEQRIVEESLEESLKEAYAYSENVKTFYKICDMVRSLPKERQIVVVQRVNFFKDKSDRNWFYKQLAHEMFWKHRQNGKKWMSDFENSVYAFYAPTRLTHEFRQVLKDFSKGGHLIQHVRYYHFNY